MQTDYYASYVKVWKACEKVAADLHAGDVSKDFNAGTIEATISGSKVQFVVTYKRSELTNVGIRVGLIGDESSSQFLHDLVEEQLERDAGPGRPR